jgi:hypothetical protein
MNMHHQTRRLLLVGVFSSLLFLALSSPLFASTLVIEDCIKCHALEPQQVAEAGAAHKEAVNCLDCHAGHRPVSPNNIPACNDCHAGTDHYALNTCMGCHNPHQPLKVTLTGELKAECLTCHTEQNDQMVAVPSMHAEVSCNFCHADTHGFTPDCSSCHAPHAPTMVENDCAVCHAAHQPTALEYPATTPNLLCAACHQTAFDQLQATSTKHSTTNCVDCHAEKHATMAFCTDCHGQPHAAGIHSKFPSCGDCHGTAHDLNNLQ